MSAADIVNCWVGHRPADYHCTCQYCQEFIGELKQPDGSYYSRLERREYYAPEEKRKADGSGHIAKTPLHVARWAIQNYSREGDWVLDPTIGAGTTAVEALTQGRHVAGLELEYGDVLVKNIERAMEHPQARDCQAKVAQGDARQIKDFFAQLDTRKVKRRFNLIVNNPPYSGDVSAYPERDGDGAVTGNATYEYDPNLPNLAHLKEGEEYWDAIGDIYEACIDRLESGGHFVIGVKDMMRRKEPYLLHFELAELLESMGLTPVGTAVLRHHPGTWFLNSYEKVHGVKPPLYQTITVFQKA